MKMPYQVPNYLGQTAAAMPQGQGMLRPLRSLEELQADYALADSDLDLASQLLSTEYIPNSGALGAVAMMVNAYQGKKTKKGAEAKIADLMRESSELMTRKEREELEKAAAAERRRIEAVVAAGFTPGQAQAIVQGGLKASDVKPKEKDPYQQYLESLPPEKRDQAFAVKAGLAARPGSGTSVNIAGPESEEALAIRMGWMTPDEARVKFRRDQGLELPLDKQMAADADAAKADQRAGSALNQAGDVLQTVNEAKALVGPMTAGLGSAVARVPGTGARDLQAKLTTIKANLGFDKLQQMREMSPTGGALGQVAVQELESLQATVASLDQAQSPAELQAALDKISRHYTRWQQTVAQSRPQGSRPGEIIPNSQAGGNDDELLMRWAPGG